MENMALVVHQGIKHRNEGVPTCSNCGKSGHATENCWKGLVCKNVEGLVIRRIGVIKQHLVESVVKLGIIRRSVFFMKNGIFI